MLGAGLAAGYVGCIFEGPKCSQLQICFEEKGDS